MIIKGNTVGTPMPRTNYEQTDPSKGDYLKGKSVLDQKIEEAKQAGVTAAANAQSAANKAQSAASAAQSAASAAQTTADEAKSMATLANSSAAEAFSAANSAKNSADQKLPLEGGTLTGSLSIGDETVTAERSYSIWRKVGDVVKRATLYWTGSGNLRLQANIPGVSAGYNYLQLKEESTNLGKPLEVGSGGTNATTGEAARTNLGIGVELWKGSWNSGTIKVTGTEKYTMYLIDMDGKATLIPVFRDASSIRGLGGYSSSSPAVTSYQFGATVSGENWTWVGCTGLYHAQKGVDSGIHGTLENMTVSRIIGVF